jgi:hypothetical protein
MILEHPDRRRWVEEISTINQRLNADSGAPAESAPFDWEALRERFGPF